MLKATGLLAAALLLFSSGAAYSRSQAKPTTLVSVEGRIRAFAQDGNHLAWASVNLRARCPWQVQMSVLKRSGNRLKARSARPVCATGEEGFQTNWINLVVAGNQALWTYIYWGNYVYVQPMTVTYGNALARKLDELVSVSARGDGDQFGGAAGDSGTLVYGVTYVSCDEDDPDSDVCSLAVDNGYVQRVSGRKKAGTLDTPPPAMLAAAGKRIAIVVAERLVTGDGLIAPGSPGTVQVTDTYGANVGSFSSEGTPLAVALSPSVVAVLESMNRGRKIEFRRHDGTLIRTVPVPNKADELSLTDKRAVFRVGNSLRTVAVKAGSVSELYTAATKPIGPSIEGTRVAWAENVKIHGVRRGRIRAITVP